MKHLNIRMEPTHFDYQLCPNVTIMLKEKNDHHSTGKQRSEFRVEMGKVYW